MCYETDARPPDHGHGGTAGPARDLVLTSADGAQFDARLVRAGGPTGLGIVILPDVRGLDPYYRALACRFSELGFDSIAIDYFGRTAGLGPRDDHFDFMLHVEQTRPESIAIDVAAAIEYLRSPDGGAARRIYTVGFCFGGGCRGASRQASRSSPARSACTGGRSVPSTSSRRCGPRC